MNSAPAGMSEPDRELLKKCREAVYSYLDEGHPLKDAMEQDEIEAALRLLVALTRPAVVPEPDLTFKRSGPSPNSPGWTTFNVRTEDADEAEARLRSRAPAMREPAPSSVDPARAAFGEAATKSFHHGQQPTTSKVKP